MIRPVAWAEEWSVRVQRILCSSLFFIVLSVFHVEIRYNKGTGFKESAVK